MKKPIALILVMTGISAVAWIRCPVARDAVITVDPRKTYQTMKGWEVTARLWEQDKARDRYDPSWQDHSAEVFSRLVNELGIDRIRIEIKSGAENPIDYWYSFATQRIGYTKVRRHRFEKLNDNDDPSVVNWLGFQFSELDHQVKMLLPIKRLVEANGEKLFVNLTYVDFGQTEEKGNISHARQPNEYAELIYVTFVHLKKTYGITPDAFEIVLEPDNTDHWRGREIGVAVVAVSRRLNEAGFFPQIIVSSTAHALASVEYFDRMIEVPGVAKVASTFAYHRYDGAVAATVALPRIRDRARQFGIDTAMLEHLQGDVGELHDDLTVANVSSWQQWAIATNIASLAERGGYYYLVELNSGDRPIVTMAPRSRALAQYFRFVRAGAVRIAATSNNGDEKAVAFRNTNGMHVVVVQANRQGTISVVGLPGGSYGVRRTTADETGRELDAIDIAAGQALKAVLPAKGVITFYQRESVR
jgi:O-glycosyl hydrolase